MLAIPFDKFSHRDSLTSFPTNRQLDLVRRFFLLHLGSSKELLRELGGTTKGVRRHYFGSPEALLTEFGGTIPVSRRNYLRRASDIRQEGELLREVLDRA
jgi:hypothetical protein